MNVKKYIESAHRILTEIQTGFSRIHLNKEIEEKGYRESLPAESKRKTVLVAEDTRSSYLLIAALLGKKYKLIHVEDGLEAVETVQKNPVDLILMDVKMPWMDGISATVEIRKFNPDVPIVVLTACVFDVNRETVLKAGCNDYLSKPLHIKELLIVLEKYCPICCYPY